jgi:hypothetical protein
MFKNYPYSAPGLGALLLFFLMFGSLQAQIFQPEGLNMPGDWNGWSNPPAANSPYGSEFQVTNGGMKKITSGTTRWQTTFTGTSGGAFLFTSGPTGNPWGNKWGDVGVTLNTLQNYNIGGGVANNSITCNASKHYTAIWQDNGYSNTQAIFMETANAPVAINTVNQTPAAGMVTPSNSVTINLTVSSTPSPEEIVYVRWTTDNFATSTMSAATMVGNAGSVVIGAQPEGTTVQYYVMTSTVASISGNYDMQSIQKSNLQSYTSASAPPVDVTFQVDMANETVSPNGVHVAGTFNGFNTSSHPLSLISGTLYGAVIPIAQSSVIEYKFLNGNTGSDYETVTGGCELGNGNRSLSVGSSDITILPVCYSKCASCVPKVNVTFQVNMAGLTVSPNGIHLAGGFGSNYPTWNPGGIALSPVGGGVYSVTLQLVPGSVVQYKFINGNAWGGDEGVPGACNVSGNRQYTVPGIDSNIPLICFGTCGNCVAVTFQVDMSGQTVSGNGIHVAGAFQSWNPGSTQLNFVGGGVYSVTVNVDPNTTSQYKFVNGNSWGTDEGVPGVCNVSGNRSFSVGSAPLTIPVVCFARCIGCTDENLWTGAQNTNFGNGNNWTAGVAPTGCDFNVKIGSSANAPNITGGTFTAGSLSFATGSTMTVAPGATINVCGPLTINSGNAHIVGGGTVIMNGTSAQTILGNLNVASLRINNPSGVSLGASAKLTISEKLKLESGAFTTSAGQLIMNAGPGFQSRLLKVEPGASFVGDMTFRKQLPSIPLSESGAWFFTGSPVAGFSLGAYNQSGNSFHPTTFDPTSENPASLYLYNNIQTANSDDFGWVKSNSAAQVPAEGQGVRVWGKSNFLSNPGRFEFTGAPNVGPVTFPVAYCNSGCSYPVNGANNGWNFLANPYPGTIDWNAATGWTKSGIASNAIYIWNAATKTYATFDGTAGANGGSRYIAAGQAFFINATGAGSSLDATEDVKADENSLGLRSNAAQPAGLKIVLTSSGMQDEAFLDISADRQNVRVAKLQNPVMNLGIGSLDQMAVIAGKNAVADGNLVPLSFRKTGSSATIKLEKTGEGWEAYNLYLRDELTSQVYPITGTSFSLPFSVVGGDEQRFSLLFTNGVTGVHSGLSSEVTLWPNPAENQIRISQTTGENLDFQILNLQGAKMMEGKVQLGVSNLNIGNLPTGQYMVRIPSTGTVLRFVKK